MNHSTKTRIKNLLFGILAVSLLILVLLVYYKNNEEYDSTSVPTPPVAEALSGLELYDGWIDPRALADPINTGGWEDSALISLDGERLYFGYTTLDYSQLMKGNLSVIGPTRDGHHGDNFDIYEAYIMDGHWIVKNSSVNSNDPSLSEAAIGIDECHSKMAFIRFDPEGDIYLSTKEGNEWARPVKLPSPINSSCIEDNPHLSEDGMTLYFDSNRLDPIGLTCHQNKGNRQIYYSLFQNGSWSEPKALIGGPNQSQFAWQVFMYQQARYVYWSGRNPEGASCLFKSERLSDYTYGSPSIIAKASLQPEVGNVVSINEMSITRNGRYLYFVYIQYNGPNNLDFNIGVAHK